MVGDAILGKRTVQRRLGVLRLPSGAWKTPHIRDSLNLVAFEQRQKRLQRTRRMAYRPDRVHRRGGLMPNDEAFGHACSANLVQHPPLMHGDVVGGVAPDLVLRLIFAGIVHKAFVLRIACVDLDYSAGHMASLGIPGNMIAHFEVFAQLLRASARTRIEILVWRLSEENSHRAFATIEAIEAADLSALTEPEIDVARDQYLHLCPF